MRGSLAHIPTALNTLRVTALYIISQGLCGSLLTEKRFPPLHHVSIGKSTACTNATWHSYKELSDVNNMTQQ